jgi:hypothetical protein
MRRPNDENDRKAKKFFANKKGQPFGQPLIY